MNDHAFLVDPTKRALISVLVAVVAGGIFLCGVDGAPAFSDSAMYICLAKALAQGSGYTSIWMSSDPPHIKFPPFLPLLLSPLVADGGGNIIALKSVMALCAAVGLAVLYYVFAQKDMRLAALAILGSVFSPSVRHYSSVVLSEMPFILIVALLVMVFQRWERSHDGRSCGHPVLIGLLIAAAIMTRLVGVAVLMGMMIYLIILARAKRVTFRQASCMLGPALIWCAWWVWRVKTFDVPLEGYAAYVRCYAGHYGLGGVGRIGGVLLRNLYATGMYAVPELMTGWRFSGPHVATAMVSILAAWGYWLSIRKRITLPDVYVACFFGVVLCWPDMNISGVRFLLPLTPFLLWYVGCGVLGIAERWLSPERGRRIALIIFCGIIASQGVGGIKSFAQGSHERRESAQLAPSFFGAMQWLRDNTRPEEVIMPSPNAAAGLFLYSGRKTVLVTHADFPDALPSPRKVSALIQDAGVDYGVIIRGLLETPVSIFLEQQFASAFPVCFENDMVTVYDMRR